MTYQVCVSMVVSMEICWLHPRGKKIFRPLSFNLVTTLLAKHTLQKMHTLCTNSSSGTMYVHMYTYLLTCVPHPKSPSHTHHCMSYSSADEVMRCILAESLVSILIYIGQWTSVPTEHLVINIIHTEGITLEVPCLQLACYVHITPCVIGVYIQGS